MAQNQEANVNSWPLSELHPTRNRSWYRPWSCHINVKVFNDPIHGHVELHPLLVKMINTPQFNRLRYIKQLGGAYFVFPGACHNRFEHSIGVAHLAGELAQALRRKQPELDITDRDILCVQIAGLCHDLGHGPFSHLFDQMFIPKARPDETWKHEENSVKMLDDMVEVNELTPVMKRYGLKMPEDMNFIKTLISGLDTDNGVDWNNAGRGEEKSFLYDIVANKSNGIDVDKFDYFARDCHHLGIQNHFDHQRFFVSARVCEVDGLKRICCRDKEVHNLYAMFYARCSFHRKAYQHKTNKLIETMITDAFIKADEHIISIMMKSSEEKTKLSEAIHNIQLYTKLTDRVFEEILFSDELELKDAKEILNRVITRDLYKCVGKVETKNISQVKHLWNDSIGQIQMREEDFAFVVTKLDYGMKEEDPINKVHFYSKSDPTNAFQIPRDQVSRLLPECFCETYIRIYCKKNESVDAAKEHFKQCYNENDFTILRDGDPEIIARDNGQNN